MWADISGIAPLNIVSNLLYETYSKFDMSDTDNCVPKQIASKITKAFTFKMFSLKCVHHAAIDCKMIYHNYGREAAYSVNKFGDLLHVKYTETKLFISQENNGYISPTSACIKIQKIGNPIQTFDYPNWFRTRNHISYMLHPSLIMQFLLFIDIIHVIKWECNDGFKADCFCCNARGYICMVNRISQECWCIRNHRQTSYKALGSTQKRHSNLPNFNIYDT